MTLDTASVATNATKKPKKSFVKSVKSVAKGLSLKRKKKRSDGDDESVLSVALDNGGANNSTVALKSAAGGGVPQPQPTTIIRSSSPPAAVGSSSSSSPAKPIQVFVLLMDPTSRRFELLQLEFDANKATVGDIQHQIKHSATEKTLRDMVYDGVCDRMGVEMISSMKLLRFCNGGDVVMAMPRGMTGKETAKLAKPILNDPKVENMLGPSKLNVQSKPAKRNNQVLGAKLPEIAEEGNRNTNEHKPTFTTGNDTKRTPSSNMPTRAIIIGIIISSLFYLTIQHHHRVTRPLESGSVLLPGQWKSPCGLYDMLPQKFRTKFPAHVLPPACESSSSSSLELGSDGVLRYFKEGSGGERRVVRSVDGGSIGNGGQRCPEGSNNEQCTENGALFVKDGYNWYLIMGDKRIVLSWEVMRDFTSSGK